MKPTVRDIIRLNALAIKRERVERPDDSIFLARRCAFLGEGSARVVFREPCLGHEIWLDEVAHVVDLDQRETFFAMDAFVCATEIKDLPEAFDKTSVSMAVKVFLERIKPYTRGQIAAATLYCRVGIDPLRGEIAAPKPGDGDELADKSFSIALGILRHGIAIGVGLTLADAVKMPRAAFEAMVDARGRRDGAIDLKRRANRLEDDYLRTLDGITARLKTEEGTNA